MADYGLTSLSGVTDENTSDTWMLRCNVNVPSACTLDSISVALRSVDAGAQAQFALYDSTDALVAASGIFTVGEVDPLAFVTETIAGSIPLTAGDYYIAWMAVDCFSYAYLTSATGYNEDVDLPTFGTPNDPFDALVTETDRRHASYITVTEAGGGGGNIKSHLSMLGVGA